jgi:hypothetical protein
LKAALGGIDDTDDDAALELAINTASREIDRWCGRRFWEDAEDTTRYFDVTSPRTMWLRGSPESVDVQSVTSAAADMSGDGTYDRTIVEGTDFWLSPRTAAADSRPYRRLEALPGWSFPCGRERVKIVGTFGWAAVPPEVAEACILQSSRIFKRAREAPFGVASLTLDGGGIRLLARLDADVELLLQPYRIMVVA